MVGRHCFAHASIIHELDAHCSIFHCSSRDGVPEKKRELAQSLFFDKPPRGGSENFLYRLQTIALRQKTECPRQIGTEVKLPAGTNSGPRLKKRFKATLRLGIRRIMKTDGGLACDQLHGSASFVQKR